MSGEGATIAAVGEGMYARDHAAQALGIHLDEIGRGTARMSMTVRPDMMNGHGTCHGGILFTLADTAFAYACNSYNQAAVAVHCTISFLSPGRLGERLTAIARETALDGRDGVYDIDIQNESGRIIATFRGVSRRLKDKVVDGPAIA